MIVLTLLILCIFFNLNARAWDEPAISEFLTLMLLAFTLRRMARSAHYALSSKRFIAELDFAA